MITLKFEQAPRGRIDILVHEDGCFTIKDLSEFANPFKKKSGEECGNGF